MLRFLSLLVPVRWRVHVLRDLQEEGRSAWATAWHMVAIALRLRARALTQRLPSMDGVFVGFLRSDIQVVWRHLRRSPGSAVISVVTLSVAVAAVVIVVAVVDRTIINPLPFKDPGRLTAIWRIDPQSPNNWLNTTRGDVAEWRRDVTTLTPIVAAQNFSMTFTGFEDGGAPLMRRVSHRWFETLGITPVVGRTFTADEDRPNGPPVAMISYDTWQRRFAGRHDVTGRSVELDNVSYSIVGVTPQHYYNPVFPLVDLPEAFLPLGLAEAGESRSAPTLLTIGRLAPDATIADAQTELMRVSERQAVAAPDTNHQFRATVQPLDEQLVRPLRTPLLLLLVAVVGLFVAACGNVANLTLVRVLARRQAHAVQQALGASRLRIMLQTFAESVIVAAVSGTIAMAVAATAGPAVQGLTPPGFLTPTVTFALGPAALVMAALITVIAALLSSLPALISCARPFIGTELGAGAVKAVGGRERRAWAGTLVAIEMAVATVLLSGAGLAALGFAHLRDAPHGFDPLNALTFRVSTRGPDFVSPESRFQFFERLHDEFRLIPGVTAAGGMNALPVFGQFGERGAYRSDAVTPPEPGREPRVTVIPVTPGFFDAMGISLRDGRDVSTNDRTDAPAVAVLSRTAAARLFGTDEPVARSFVLVEGTRLRRVEVVGEVADVRSSVDPSMYTAVVYLPLRQSPAPTAFGFVLRSEESTATVTRQAQTAVARVNRSMPLFLLRPLTDVAASLEATMRFTSVLLTTFALLGLTLVASGLYGTLAHLVEDRRREMGVRLALGATRANVLRLVLRDGLRPALTGLAIGWIGALGFGQVIARMVNGTPAFQWSLFLWLPAALLVLGAAASIVPALRATRVDPITALRTD